MALLHQLNHEWTELLSHSPIPTWSTTIPEVAACVCAGDVLALLPGFAEPVLSGLVRLAQAGDQLAARTVLQAMLPKLVRMSRTGIARSRRDALDDLVSAMAARILTHRPRRSSTAGNLALDSLKDALHLWQGRSPGSEVALPTNTLEFLGRADTPPLEGEVAEVLSTALDQGWISQSTHDLLDAVYGTHGASSTEVAARLGCQPATVRSRCRNGVAQLRDHKEQLLELV